MSGDIKVRPAGTDDEAGWRRLWQGYLTFYETELPAAVTELTWRRIVSEDVTHIGALVAERPEAGLVGMLNFVIHDNTWTDKAVCYLQDLFVEESERGQGIARALIEHLVEIGRAEAWLRIYWHTARDNVQAQALYSKIAERTGWVRYDLDLA